MVVSFEVFRKCSPNGKISIFVTKRDITDYVTHMDKVEGVLLIDPSFVCDKNVYAQIALKFRFGREDEETMHLNFVKTMNVETKQIFPILDDEKMTEIQHNLVSKLGDFAYPFTLPLPKLCSPSYTMQRGWEDGGALISMEMEAMVFVGAHEGDIHDRSTVRLHIRRLQQIPETVKQRAPLTATVSRYFMACQGSVNMEGSLDSFVYRPNEPIHLQLNLMNKTNRELKKLKIKVIQISEVPMLSQSQKREKTLMKLEDGVQLPPGACTNKTFELSAMLPSKRATGTVFLQGDLHNNSWPALAQTTLLPQDVSRGDIFGVLVSYIVRVKGCLGPLVGEAVIDMPFVLETNY